MIDPSETIYYLTYGMICLALGIFYVRLKSQDGTQITTKEFQTFQASFITGYSCILFCEFIAAASFYHTFIAVHLDLEQIAKLYIVTHVASTLTGVAMEIVEVGTRKDKCIVAALLYSVSMFSIFFGGHYEMLLMGRILYGAASALQQTAFESYAVHAHATQGFPDDWLSQTFSLLTHVMAAMAALSGIVGQVAAGMGQFGCVALCCLLFAFVAVYLAVMWEKDINTPRFMLQGFLFNLQQSLNALRSNRHVGVFVAIASLTETSILVFTFYWAPWLSQFAAEEDQRLPYEIIFSCFLGMSMLGNYLFQMISSSNSSAGGSPLLSTEQVLQFVLLGTAAAYFIGAILQTHALCFYMGLVIQMGVGLYWPAIGFFRGRLLPQELRNLLLVVQKVCTVILTTSLLRTFLHQPFLLLSSCAACVALAAYLQQTQLDSKVLSQLAIADDDDDGSFDLDDDSV